VGEEVGGDSHGGYAGGDLVQKAWTRELRLESACSLSSGVGSCSIASNEPAELTITAAAMSRRECRSAAAEVLGLVGCRRRGASSSSPAGAGGVVGGEDFGWGGCVRFCCYVGERGGSGADRRLGGEEVLCEGRGEGERDRVWGGLYMSVVSIFDRQIVRLTATSS
jgi:hypothetical protein